MTFDFTTIFEGLILIILGILTKIIIPFIKAKINIQTNAETEYWIKLAVQAIEQISTTQGQKGKAKKEYVVNWLKEHNITYDEAKIDAQIESAVYQLKLEAEKGILIEKSTNTEPEKEGE